MFLTQRLANNFPHWSKVRRDPSSLGQRFFEPFAEYMTHAHQTIQLVDDELHLLKWRLGKGELGVVDLEAADYITVTSGLSGGKVYTYPTTVTGSQEGDDYELTRYETLEDMLGATPTRLELADVKDTATSDVVWSTEDPTTFDIIPRPDRLSIEVSDSTVYNRNTLTSDRLFSGKHAIYLEGTDQNDVVITEVISVLDDGVFRTRNIWKTLTDVTYEGFDGDINIYWHTGALSFQVDPYNVAVFGDFESPLLLSLDQRGDNCFLQYKGVRLKRGDEYRREGTDIDALGNTELLSEAFLTFDVTSEFEGLSLAVNPEDTLLYVLDTDGFVYVYNHGPTPFGPPQADRTISTDTSIRIQPVVYYPAVSQTIMFWTRHERLRSLISSVQIIRRRPDGVETYLQADKTWGVGVYSFTGNNDAQIPEESWTDFSFTCEDLSTTGQWEFWCIAVTGDGTQTSYTAVMVDTIDALVTLDPGIGSATSIAFTHDGLLAVNSAGGTAYFSVQRDAYIADPNRQRLLTYDAYDSVEVVL